MSKSGGGGELRDPFGWVVGDNEDSSLKRDVSVWCGVASPSVRLLIGVLLYAARQHQMIVLAASHHRHQQSLSLSLIEHWIYYATGHCWPPIFARIYLRLLPFETFSLYCVHFLWPFESCHLGQHCILSSDLICPHQSLCIILQVCCLIGKWKSARLGILTTSSYSSKQFQCLEVNLSRLFNSTWSMIFATCPSFQPCRVSCCSFAFNHVYLTNHFLIDLYALSNICSKRREKQLNRLHSSCSGLHSTSYRRKAIPGPPGEGGSGIRGGGFDKNASTGLGGNSNGNNKDKNFLCPNCGNVCTQIEEFLCEFTLYSPLNWRLKFSLNANPFLFYDPHWITASTRFVKCDKCARFFVILSENDLHKNAKENASPHIHKTGEKFNIQKNPPPPKKVASSYQMSLIFWQVTFLQIYEYLEKRVIGQYDAKKVLAVAVYNHYKRINHNILSHSNGRHLAEASNDTKIINGRGEWPI